MSFIFPGWALSGRRVSSPHTVSTVTTPPILEPLTVAEAKLFARFQGTDLDTLIPGFIQTARVKVEQDTGYALLTQTRDVSFDALPNSGPIVLPEPANPLQSVTSVTYTDTGGIVQTLALVNYVVDDRSKPARLGLSDLGVWPSDLRAFQPFTIRIVVGWTAVNLIPAPLVHAVGLLVGFYINEGGSRFADAGGPLVDQYEDTIAPFRNVYLV